MRQNRLNLLIAFVITGMVALLAGCSSSKESAVKPTVGVPVPVPDAETKTAEQPRVDTVTVSRQTAEKSVIGQTPADYPRGRYSIQIGAYKMAENADRIVQLTKERFVQKVFTIQDKADNLFKVYVGDFMAKDEARSFRDEMVQKFPVDYKDAWVADVAQK
jgi:cell division septation protein DedD